jgi:hypothetical protein
MSYRSSDGEGFANPVEVLMMILLVIGLIMAFTGCKEEREARLQAAADACAGVDALADQPADAPIAQAAKTNVYTASDAAPADLPAPTMTPDAIRKDPPAYGKKAEETAKAAEEAGSLWPWLTGAGLFVLGLARVLPGVHAPIVEMLQRILENRASRKARERQATLAAAAKEVVRIIEDLPATTTMAVKAAISTKVSSASNDAIKNVLKEISSG